jgi:hypothetical protein
VDHPPAVRVGDRVAHRHELAQQLPQGQAALARVAARHVGGVEAGDGLLEGLPADEAHGVEEAAVAVGAQAVDRDDPRVLQLAVDLRLQQEAAAAARVVGVGPLDLLEGHLPAQFPVLGHEDLPRAAPGVRPQHPEAHRAAQRRVVVAEVVHRAGAGGRGGGRDDRADVGEAGVEFGVGQPVQLGTHRVGGAPGGQGRQAALGVAAVLAQVLLDQGVQHGPLVLRQGGLALEDVAQGLAFVQDPGVHAGDELVAADEVQLQRQDAEQQVAVGRGALGCVGHGQSAGGVGGRGLCAPRPSTVAAPGRGGERQVRWSAAGPLPLPRGAQRGLLPGQRHAGGRRRSSIGQGCTKGPNPVPVADLTVFLDANNNGTLDTGEAFSVTNAAGQYSFCNLAVGLGTFTNYSVSVAQQYNPDGTAMWDQPPTDVPVTVIPGQVTVQDFTLTAVPPSSGGWGIPNL